MIDRVSLKPSTLPPTKVREFILLLFRAQALMLPPPGSSMCFGPGCFGPGGFGPGSRWILIISLPKAPTIVFGDVLSLSSHRENATFSCCLRNKIYRLKLIHTLTLLCSTVCCTRARQCLRISPTGGITGTIYTTRDFSVCVYTRRFQLIYLQAEVKLRSFSDVSEGQKTLRFALSL